MATREEVYQELGKQMQEQGIGHLTDVVWRMAAVESSFDPHARNTESTAEGLWQFLNSTWAQYGEGEKTDPIAQAEAVAQLTADNISTFQKATERQPNPAEIYLAHFGGVGTSIEVAEYIRDGKGDRPISEVLSESQISSNTDIDFNGKDFAEFTVSDLYEWSQAKMGELEYSPAMAVAAASAFLQDAGELEGLKQSFEQALQSGDFTAIIEQFQGAEGAKAVALQGVMGTLTSVMQSKSVELGLSDELLAKVREEQGFVGAETLKGMDSDAIGQKLEQGEWLKVGDEYIDLTKAKFGEASQEQAQLLSDKLVELKENQPDLYEQIIEAFKAELAKGEKKQGMDPSDRRDMTSRSGAGFSDMFGLLIGAALLAMTGKPDAALTLLERAFGMDEVQGVAAPSQSDGKTGQSVGAIPENAPQRLQEAINAPLEGAGWQEQLVNYANGFRGMQEDPLNTGPLVAWAMDGGQGRDQPWCGGFMNRIYDRVIGQELYDQSNYKAAISFREEGERHGAWIDADSGTMPEVGDTIVRDRPGGNHVEMVIAVNPNTGEVTTISGNRADRVQTDSFNWNDRPKEIQGFTDVSKLAEAKGIALSGQALGDTLAPGRSEGALGDELAPGNDHTADITAMVSDNLLNKDEQAQLHTLFDADGNGKLDNGELERAAQALRDAGVSQIAEQELSPDALIAALQQEKDIELSR